MTKADLVEKISLMTSFTKKESSEIVERVFDVVKSTLEAGENIKIAGFGNFEDEVLVFLGWWVRSLLLRRTLRMSALFTCIFKKDSVIVSPFGLIDLVAPVL